MQDHNLAYKFLGVLASLGRNRFGLTFCTDVCFKSIAYFYVDTALFFLVQILRFFFEYTGTTNPDAQPFKLWHIFSLFERFSPHLSIICCHLAEQRPMTHPWITFSQLVFVCLKYAPNGLSIWFDCSIHRVSKGSTLPTSICGHLTAVHVQCISVGCHVWRGWNSTVNRSRPMHTYYYISSSFLKVLFKCIHFSFSSTLGFAFLICLLLDNW